MAEVKQSLFDKYGRLLKLMPLGAFSIIVASAAKHFYYYQVFDINITEYFQLTEYIPLFIDDLFIISQYILSGIFGFMLASIPNKKSKGEEKINDLTNKKSKLMGKIMLWGIIVFIVGAIAVYFAFDNWYDRLDKYVGLPFILVFLLFMFFVFTKKSLAPGSFYLMILIITIATIILSGHKDAYKIIEDKEDLVHKVFIKDQVGYFPEYVKYIGASEKYLFLYNSKNKESIIYPMSVIKEIRIKKKK